MGCKCSDEKNSNISNNNIKNKIITSNNLINKKKNNNKEEEEADKISSLSSINSEDVFNSIEKITKNKKIPTENKKENIIALNNIQKNNIESLDNISIKNSFQQNPNAFTELKNKDNNDNMLSNIEYTCNISKINNNNNENKKYKYKINERSPVKKLINSIKNDIEYKENDKNIFLYYKGKRIDENDTIYNIINMKNNQLENILNNNNKQKETNELDFDMISYSIDKDEEDNINDDFIIKKEKDSFTSNESEQEKIEKLRQEKIKLKKIDKEKNISKKIMYKLSPTCKKHNQEYLIYICLTCFHSFCHLDYNEHKKEFKSHEIIQKSKLLELKIDIKRIKSNLIDIYKEINFELYNSQTTQKILETKEKEKYKINYISSNDLFSKLKVEINDINEQIENLYDSYRQSYNKTNSKFLSLYEDKMPKNIEYDEYIEKTLFNSENLNIFSNENLFIDNYNDFINIKNTSNKYFQNLISLKEIIINYKEFLESFREKGKKLIEYIRKGIDDIIKSKNGEKNFNMNGGFLQFNDKGDSKSRISFNLNNNLTNNIKNLNNITISTNKDINQKINLKFLLGEKKNKISKSVISKNFLNNNTNISNGCSSIIKKKRNNNSICFKENINIEVKNKNNMNENINEIHPKYEKEREIQPNEIDMKSPSNLSSKRYIKFDINSSLKGSSNSTNKENELIQSYLLSLIYGTKNIIQYVYKTKKMNIFSPDISTLKIKKFECYISYINFKNKFYISGGYSTSKQFFEYDINNNKFIKLPEMLSNHYYHTMIGNENFIYSISGFKSKKIEKYNILDKVWTPLPDLTYERTYPNALIYNNSIFIFGKVNDSIDEENDYNIIEHINITEYNNYNKWNQIKLKAKFPFNSGILMLDKEQILLVGGKLELNENSIDNCYYMNINNFENEYKIDIKISKITLDQPSEFNGNIFNTFDENYLDHGLFSSINPYLLFLYNKNTNSFKTIQFDNKE